MKPNVNLQEMEVFYNDNEEFKRYVDRYSVKHQITHKAALTHLLVKYAYMEYKRKKEEKVEEAPVQKEKIFAEDKAC